jgi:dTMP kinase
MSRAAATFITFEGGEGAGKSTQVRLLAERLKERGIDVLATREPGGSPFAEHVRNLILDPATPPHGALAEALLFYAARADHLEEAIRPALAAGRWVIADRFSDSTRAYQGIAGGLGLALIEELERLVIGASEPALTFLLDIDPKVGLARADRRRTSATPGTFIAVDAYEGRRVEFHERIRAAFLDIARAHPRRVVVIDAFENPTVIADRIWAEVRARLLGGGG